MTLVTNKTTGDEVSAAEYNEIAVGVNEVNAVDGSLLGSTIFSDTKYMTGFLNPDSINVSYNYTNRTITLTGTLDYYYQGKSYKTFTNTTIKIKECWWCD